jgi:ribosome-associated toxin RatA of RatAB toxin-antitoxin module
VRSRIHQLMRAPYERVFDLAADVERWPDLLPHYRYVRRVPGAAERHFEMGARRGPIPVRWRAIQRPLPEERRIEFVHTGGVTRGMEVAWRFEDHDGALDVSIEHELDLGWPVIGAFAAEHVIGPQFIEAIAGRTLRRVKELAEGGDR